MELEQAIGSALLAVLPARDGASVANVLASLQFPARQTLVLHRDDSVKAQQACANAGVERVAIGQRDGRVFAINRAIDLARTRGFKFLIVLAPEFIFATDVARQLLQAMVEDSGLAVAAPSRMSFDKRSQRIGVAYRDQWHLDQPGFSEDFRPPGNAARRLEADFCRFECAAVRMSAVDAIGGLDTDLGSGFEDLDFGFRLRAAGHGAAFIPSARVEPATAAQPPERMSAGQTAAFKSSAGKFARKHLGYGVWHKARNAKDPTSWNIINRNLHPYLVRHGLIDPSRPRLIFAHPGAKPFDYLYSVWETTRLPEHWLKYSAAYKGVFVTSRWNKEVYREGGFANARAVPLGVETDIFSPWGPNERAYDDTTFLWFSRNQYRKALDVMLAAWEVFRRTNSKARLMIMGKDVLDCLPHAAKSRRQSNGMISIEHPEARISVRETIKPLSDQQVAAIYRGVDFVVSNSRSEGFGFVVAEAMACGVVPIFANYGATAEFAFDGALLLNGQRSPADYSDMGYKNVGEWWEPDLAGLASLLKQAAAMDPATKAALTARGLNLARNAYTWRHTCFALRAELAQMQEFRLVEHSGRSVIASAFARLKAWRENAP